MFDFTVKTRLHVLKHPLFGCAASSATNLLEILFNYQLSVTVTDLFECRRRCEVFVFARPFQLLLFTLQTQTTGPWQRCLFT